MGSTTRTTVRTTTTNGQEAQMSLTTVQIQTITAVAHSLMSAGKALSDLCAPKPEPVIEPASAQRTALLVDARSNGLLTAASAKAIREALAGTPFADVKINGNSKATAAVQLLQALKVDAVVRTPDAPKVEAPIVAPVIEVPVEAVTDKAAAKAARKAAKAERKAAEATSDGLTGKELAAWLRSNEIAASGKAWELARKGERDVAVLKAANGDGAGSWTAMTAQPAIPALALVAEVPPAVTAHDEAMAVLLAGGYTQEAAEAALAAQLSV